MNNSEWGDSDDPFVAGGPMPSGDASAMPETFLQFLSYSSDENLGLESSSDSVIDLTISGEYSVNKPSASCIELPSSPSSSSSMPQTDLNSQASSKRPSSIRGHTPAPCKPDPLNRYVPLQTIHPPEPYQMPFIYRITPDKIQINDMLKMLQSLDPRASRQDAIHLIQANWASRKYCNPGTSPESDSPFSSNSSRFREMVRARNKDGVGPSSGGQDIQADRDANVACTIPPEWRVIRDIDSLLWANPEVLSTLSRIRHAVEEAELNQALVLVKPSPEGVPDRSYNIAKVGVDERICSKAREGSTSFIMMYEALFTRIGVYLPFTDFEIGVLNLLEVAPSQLHPNAWGFMKAFQKFCWVQDWPYSPLLFLSMWKPYCAKKNYWVSLRQVKEGSYFSAFEESFKDFKEEYFKIYPASGTHPFWLDQNNQPLFPLYWNSKHYEVGAGRYHIQEGFLEDAEKNTARLSEEFYKEYGSIPCKIVINAPEKTKSSCLGTHFRFLS